MSHEIEGATLGVLRLALDAATLRHQVIAHNIANANSAGHVPLRVSFDEQFEAVRAQLARSGTVDARLVAAPRGALVAQGTPGAVAPVALDMEVAELARNTLQYQALVRGVGRYLSIISVAVTEGKR